jgi:hypothetical protein
MVEKWENGPIGASAFASFVTAATIGFAEDASPSSPAINLVRRPSIHDPIPAPPLAFRPPNDRAGLAEGVPVSRSLRSSRLASRAGGKTDAPFFAGLAAASTAAQYLTISLCAMGQPYRLAWSTSPSSAANHARWSLYGSS